MDDELSKRLTRLEDKIDSTNREAADKAVGCFAFVLLLMTFLAVCC